MIGLAVCSLASARGMKSNRPNLSERLMREMAYSAEVIILAENCKLWDPYLNRAITVIRNEHLKTKYRVLAGIQGHVF